MSCLMEGTLRFGEVKATPHLEADRCKKGPWTLTCAGARPRADCLEVLLSVGSLSLGGWEFLSQCTWIRRASLSLLACAGFCCVWGEGAWAQVFSTQTLGSDLWERMLTQTLSPWPFACTLTLRSGKRSLGFKLV